MTFKRLTVEKNGFGYDERIVASFYISRMDACYIKENENKRFTITAIQDTKSKPLFYVNPLAIKKVIFNNPATIVIWEDGTKTIVKRQKGDRWDKEKGLAMAIAKKALGNKGNYCNLIKKHVEEQGE